MSSFRIGKYLPYFVSKRLFGDRTKFGLTIIPEDSDWQEWEKRFLEFYYVNQKASVGKIVNDAGYKVLNSVSMDTKKILEIGPGDIPHFRFWNGKPAEYVMADVSQEMLAKAENTLRDNDIPYEKIHLIRKDANKLPFPDKSFDIILSFYSLEHMADLQTYIDELIRVLVPGGVLVGAIPCEGGLGWGLGRFITSRRWLLKNTTINPDKIICWEHPGFADRILNALRIKMKEKYLSFWPLGISSVDLNLVVKFIYERE